MVYFDFLQVPEGVWLLREVLGGAIWSSITMLTTMVYFDSLQVPEGVWLLREVLGGTVWSSITMLTTMVYFDSPQVPEGVWLLREVLGGAGEREAHHQGLQAASLQQQRLSVFLWKRATKTTTGKTCCWEWHGIGREYRTLNYYILRHRNFLQTEIGRSPSKMAIL